MAPVTNDPSNSIALYDNQGAVVPSRTILSNSKSYSAGSEYDYGPNRNENYNNDPSVIPAYPYIQCVAYINKTHSQR